jgi:hypothetical protein
LAYPERRKLARKNPRTKQNGSYDVLKVYRVINGQIDEQKRNLAGPYFNNKTPYGNVKKKPNHERPKGKISLVPK